MKTNDFLVEILTEELPPKALPKLIKAFYDQVIDGVKKSGLNFKESQSFATPRRLAILIQDLNEKQQEQNIERKGPALTAAYDKEGNPTKAALGFAKSCGIELSKAETIKTDKGEWLYYKSTAPGKTVEALLPTIIQQALAKLPIPKLMHWGDSKHAFVRPVHNVLMMLGDRVVDATLFDLKSSNITYGHRFHHPEKVTLEQASDYKQALEKAYVLVDFNERKTLIREQVEVLAKKQKGEAQMSDALLNEVTSIVEWPVALLGNYDKRFLEVPKEVLILSMETNQKYFPIVNGAGQLLPYFITISNIQSTQPETVIHGNERVMTARLADAEFFFEVDMKTPLADRSKKLESIVFQKQLGTLSDKVKRVATLAENIANTIKGDPELIRRAVLLSKNDLVTDMVGEFPELQGIMGRYYAIHDKEPEEVAEALNELYMPRFSGDFLPATKTGIALALADRIDTLVGIFGIGKAPTGDKDPFALRRATLGVLRIIIENRLALDLKTLFSLSEGLYGDKINHKNLVDDILNFCNDRLKNWAQEQGISAKVFAAVAAKHLHDPYDIKKRLDAVNDFIQLPEAEHLAAANKRVYNILSKQGAPKQSQIEQSLLQDKAEKILAEKVAKKSQVIAQLNYHDTLFALADLQQPIDTFFDEVMVMADDEKIRNNRLALLVSIKELFGSVADLSQLAH
jgi:glycyl-tRNA synthetase beta chain